MNPMNISGDGDSFSTPKRQQGTSLSVPPLAPSKYKRKSYEQSSDADASDDDEKGSNDTSVLPPPIKRRKLKKKSTKR